MTKIVVFTFRMNLKERIKRYFQELILILKGKVKFSCSLLLGCCKFTFGVVLNFVLSPSSPCEFCQGSLQKVPTERLYRLAFNDYGVIQESWPCKIKVCLDEKSAINNNILNNSGILQPGVMTFGQSIVLIQAHRLPHKRDLPGCVMA